MSILHFNVGDSVTFKNCHGIISKGTVYDSNEIAVMVSTIFGICSVDRRDILSGGRLIHNQDDHAYGMDKRNFDSVWWEEEDTI